MSTVKDDAGMLQDYDLERKMHSRPRQRVAKKLRVRKVRAIWTAHVGAQATGRAEIFENLTDTASDDGLITDEETGRLLDTEMVNDRNQALRWRTNTYSRGSLQRYQNHRHWPGP